ncbi:MAG: MmcQ/YjbR family DNA-binding protein [Gemmataceae bacterium]|nr:MmcQ/YjbR family DNA-binding protein [Gemmataceae bacterium]
MAAEKTDTFDAIYSFALSFPGAFEDNPWGERVAKVGTKVFVFLGRKEEAFGMSVKLPHSRTEALLMPFAKPSGYGLGKHGWITVRLADGEPAPLEMLRRWVEESYRAVAPKKMVAQLDAPPPSLVRRDGVPSLARRVSVAAPARRDGIAALAGRARTALSTRRTPRTRKATSSKRRKTRKSKS